MNRKCLTNTIVERIVLSVAAMCAIASLAHGLASHVTNYDPHLCLLGITSYIFNSSAWPYKH